jgi:hypothetical protein
MISPPRLDERLRLLAARAKIGMLYPVEQMNASACTSAQTHSGVDGPELSAIRVLLVFEQPECARLEVNTFVREHILASRRNPGETDGDIVQEYMEREVRRELAMRSLELPEGAAHRLDQPLGELILARERSLPESIPVTISLDSTLHEAIAVSYGDHTAAWADLPDYGATLALYAQRWPTLPSLASLAS